MGHALATALRAAEKAGLYVTLVTAPVRSAASYHYSGAVGLQQGMSPKERATIEAQLQNLQTAILRLKHRTNFPDPYVLVKMRWPEENAEAARQRVKGDPWIGYTPHG